MSHLQPCRPSAEDAVFKVFAGILVVVIENAMSTANEDDGQV